MIRNAILGLFAAGILMACASEQVAADGVAENGRASGTMVTRAGESDVEIAASYSFFNSCVGGSAVEATDGTRDALEATAHQCLRVDGSWTGFVKWTGRCRGDIANCNGTLVCGSCGCPEC